MLQVYIGRDPTMLQLLASFGIFAAAAALTLGVLGTAWPHIALALIAGDWAGGIVANAAEPTRRWWRERIMARRAFFAVHFLELGLVWWLTGGGVVFALFALTLSIKLAVFALGRETPSQTASAPRNAATAE